MLLFLTLLVRLLPLYAIIFLGFVAAKYLGAQKETVAKLLIYIISPVVVFYGAYTVQANFANLSLPVLFFAIACAICLVFLWVGKLVYKNGVEKNVLAFTAGAGNVGYFGLPVAMMIFSDQVFGLVVLAVMGFILYESTLGFFISANGSHSVKNSLRKTARLPAIYAFVLGLSLNLVGAHLGGPIAVTAGYFKGAYSLLGMMLIGMGLAAVCKDSLDPKFISLSFLAKFVIWPAIIAAVILLDRQFLHIYDAQTYRIMILLSVVPLASNTVAYATEFKTCPDKASLAVLLSTIFALFYVPLVASLFVNLN
jgi:predicted permease